MKQILEIYHAYVAFHYVLIFLREEDEWYSNISVRLIMNLSILIMKMYLNLVMKMN